MAAPKKRSATPKRRPAASRRRPTAKKRRTRARKPLPPWLLLGGGLLAGVGSVLVFNVAKEAQWQTLWSNAQPPKTAAAKPAEMPRFDFYTILPNQEVVVPDPGPPDEKATPGPKGVYYLQVGSFRNLDEANGMRAQVILLGTEASIQSVTLGRDTWHRVRVGPYEDQAQLREVRERLRGNRIETLLIRAHK